MTAPESKASEKLDNFLAQFDLEEQERILRYALDHVVPRMKKLTPLAASTPSVEPAGAGEAPSVHAEVGEAVAWLIEHHDDGRLHYLSAQGGYLCHGNIDTALRFARKQDAEALFEHYARDEGLAGNFRWREAFRIAEHMWPPPAPAAREATTALFDIPADVIEAERKVSHWFASKNVERWELGYSKARFAQPKAQAQAEPQRCTECGDVVPKVGRCYCMPQGQCYHDDSATLAAPEAPQPKAETKPAEHVFGSTLPLPSATPRGFT